MSAWQLFPAIRDLYSRHPEYVHPEPWGCSTFLFSLGYADDLADEAEISAAVEVARGDYPQWRPAAWGRMLFWPQPHQQHYRQQGK